MKQINLKLFAHSLKEKMESQKMDKIDLAIALDISESYIYRLLNQRRRPSRDLVILFGFVFTLSPKEINAWLVCTGHRALAKKKVPMVI